MTTGIYIRARDPDNGVRVVEDLISLGVQPKCLKVYGSRIPDGVGVRAIRWRTGTKALLPGAIIGAVMGVLLGIAVSISFVLWTTLLLALFGAAIGAVWQRYLHERTFAPLGPQQDALRRGELVIVADVDEPELPRLEAQMAERHPEVLLLGPDPAGSPPFP